MLVIMSRVLSLLSVASVLWWGCSYGSVCSSSRPCHEDFCHNGGTCFLNSTNCLYQCKCSTLFTGPRCSQRNDVIQADKSPINVTGHPNRTIPQATFSVTGHSNRAITKATFRVNGYYDRTVPKASSVHGNASPTKPTALIGRSQRDVSKKPVSFTYNEDHACSPNYTYHSLKERECLFFTCGYGYCNVKDNAYDCVCDPGGDGPLCKDRCCLQCSEHGRCEVYGGKELCHCDTNYGGTLCEFHMDSMTTTTETATTAGNGPTLRNEMITSTLDNYVTPSVNLTRSTLGAELDDNLTTPSNIPSDVNSTTPIGRFTSTTAYSITTRETVNSTTKRAITTQMVTNVSTRTTPTDHLPPPVSDVCATNYHMRPQEERNCSYFVCKYGYCSVEDSLYSCNCDPGGSGPFCNYKCCLQCSEHGRCELDDGIEFCHCDTNYEGDLCESKVTFPTQEPEPDQQKLWITVGIVGVSLILAGVIIFFWMWRNRVTIVMKIVHYFQAYEEDDEKTWDSFISYKSSDMDQHFVLHVLLPKLEELGFTVCLHCRDFVPGETIANNIINAIAKSRRTILILTPRYVNSEFTRLEYQVAQHEMLKRKHRIIPVLLEDISTVNDTMDPNLKQILRCVTYLEYPGKDGSNKNINRFWKKLSLAMPKKRIVDNKEKPPNENDVVIDIKEKGSVEVREENINEDGAGMGNVNVTAL